MPEGDALEVGHTLNDLQTLLVPEKLASLGQISLN